MQQETETILAPMRASVKEQGDTVRDLKATGKPELQIKKAVAELKVRKKALEDKELELRYLVTFLVLRQRHSLNITIYIFNFAESCCFENDFILCRFLFAGQWK